MTVKEYRDMLLSLPPLFDQCEFDADDEGTYIQLSYTIPPVEKVGE